MRSNTENIFYVYLMMTDEPEYSVLIWTVTTFFLLVYVIL